VKQLRTPRSRSRSDRLRKALAGSVAAHLLVLALVLLVREMAPPPPPQDQPSFAIEFEPDQSQTKGGPNPSTATETPKGDEKAQMQPTPSTQSLPESQPQMNLIPPEYMQPPPPPQTEEAEPIPPPMVRPRYSRNTERQRADRNPFSHPMDFSLAPREQRGASAGLRTSHSLDLSAGPVIRGGHLTDAVAHVVGQGGAADYLALLSEFIETHKYYPEGAARNGEEGSATVQLTVRRDGTVRALSLASSSGSSLLDAAWMAVFRDNRLPAFTDDMPGAEETFRLTLNYELIYSR
jgi:protein TonB